MIASFFMRRRGQQSGIRFCYKEISSQILVWSKLLITYIFSDIRRRLDDNLIFYKGKRQIGKLKLLDWLVT